MNATNRLIWDDCRPNAKHGERWAASRRGWLFVRVDEMPRGMNRPDVYREQLKVWTEPSSVGNYLDYGPDHYRAPHEYCEEGACKCRLSQPGNIHCVVYNPNGGQCFASRYVESVEQAHIWIEEQVRKVRAELFEGKVA